MRRNVKNMDISCFAKRGNTKSSISDHFLQFSIIDLLGNFDTNTNKNTNLTFRNWRIFNRREFDEVLESINWSEEIKHDMDDTSCSFFLNKINTLLD